MPQMDVWQVPGFGQHSLVDYQMNMKTSTSAFSAFILALLAGCLTTTPPPQSDWNIECSERAACLAETPKFGVAKLALVEVRAPYSVREVAVLRADGSMAFDQFNMYAASPVQLIKSVSFAALERSGLFKAVVGSSSSADSDVEIEVAVTKLALDCREDGVRRAVAEISLRLVRAHAIVGYAKGLGSADASGANFASSVSDAVTAAFANAMKKL